MTRSPVRRMTQRRLAEQLGLSPATVSLALRDSPLIAEATRAEVKRAMAETGYVANRAAAALRTARSHLVGVSFHDVTNPYFASLLAALEAELAGSGRVLMLNNHGDDPANQARFLDALHGHGADGVLISPARGAGRAALTRFIQGGAAVVTVARDMPADLADLRHDFAGADDRAGLKLATAHLIRLGHTRIAIIGGFQDITVGRQRVAGYRDALEAGGLPFDQRLVIEAPFTRSGGLSAARHVMAFREPPTALVGYNDLVAFGAMNALRQLGLEPGVDVAVTGCDDLEEAAGWVPPLTSVATRPAEIGQAAARMLIERIERPELASRRFLLTPSLSVRVSCGAQGGPQLRRLTDTPASAS
ncbi:MAG: LacI family DNA-binding transcriptional regulator [Geminicoccaceae bacterium]